MMRGDPAAQVHRASLGEHPRDTYKRRLPKYAACPRSFQTERCKRFGRKGRTVEVDTWPAAQALENFQDLSPYGCLKLKV